MHVCVFILCYSPPKGAEPDQSLGSLSHAPMLSQLHIFLVSSVAELAPQYFLSNLPPSESRDLLMELREKLAEDTTLPGQGENPQTPKAAEDAGDACVLQ